MATILVIDDNTAVRTALEVLLSLEGWRVVGAADPQSGLARLGAGDVDLVIQDMNFRKDTTSGDEGVELFHEIRRCYPAVPIILLTAWTHLETAVDLVKAGAADYLGKPWDDRRLLTTIRNLLDLRRATLETRRLVSARAATRRELAARFDLRGAVYESDAMHAALTMATQVAHSDVAVLITGPNGAGKEVIADIVQANSRVSRGPFVKVNVGALPQELMEAELFGVEAGAFTGATRARQGRFEAADGGTLFLDEIGNLSLPGQTKLLRVLQTGQFERLGSSLARHASVRLISATNADLLALIADGRFREDLYYRLNVIELKVPGLAERRDDVLPLAGHFLAADCRLDPTAERALMSHSWPGNVRELANAIQRACLLAPGGVISAEHLALATPPASVKRAEHEPHRAEIEEALDRADGVVARAARNLGLSRQSLYRRMEKLGMKD